MRELRDAIIGLESTFLMRSVLRCYKQDKASVLLVGRQSPVSKRVNTEAQKVTALEAFTRRQCVNIQLTEKNWRVL